MLTDIELIQKEKFDNIAAAINEQAKENKKVPKSAFEMENDDQKKELWEYIMMVNAELDDCRCTKFGATKEALLRAIEKLDEEFAKWIRLPNTG